MLRDTRLARPFERHRLQRAAQQYVDHRWPVVPGARLRGDRFACDQIGCPTLTCHPALPDWQNTASLDPARIAGWWQRANYGVLLATGHTFDVLEVAGPIGWKLAREARGPIAVARAGLPAGAAERSPRSSSPCRSTLSQRWMFFVRPDAHILPALAEHPSVVLHRGGSWIPAPPTPLPTGTVRWLARPAEYDWEPADPLAVQRAAARLLRDDRQPRQVWQLNRAAIPSVE
jgi:bifunctional DNA primase/polymerase-like protein